MSLTEDALAVERLYPKLYVACHSSHRRVAGVATTLSARECAVLSHLFVDPTVSASCLAKHLGVGRSTMSEVVSRLMAQGFLQSHQHRSDERRRRLCVTAVGIAAMSVVSVLDHEKVATVLSRLTPQERVTAIEGLALLADAAIPARAGDMVRSGRGRS